MEIHTKRKVHYHYFKDYRPVKLCFVVLTTYLIWEEFFEFFFVKPTYTSVTRSTLGKFNKKKVL